MAIRSTRSSINFWMRIALTQRNRRTPHADIVTTRVRGMLCASVRRHVDQTDARPPDLVRWLFVGATRRRSNFSYFDPGSPSWPSFQSWMMCEGRWTSPSPGTLATKLPASIITRSVRPAPRISEGASRTTCARPLTKSWCHGRECGRETFLPRGAKGGGRIRRRIAGGGIAGAEPSRTSSSLQSMDLSSRALRLAEQRDYPGHPSDHLARYRRIRGGRSS